MTRSTDLAVWHGSLARMELRPATGFLREDHTDCKHLPLRVRLSARPSPTKWAFPFKMSVRMNYLPLHELAPDFERFIRDLEDFNRG
jgi:hypothetical protein